MMCYTKTISLITKQALYRVRNSIVSAEIASVEAHFNSNQMIHSYRNRKYGEFVPQVDENVFKEFRKMIKDGVLVPNIDTVMEFLHELLHVYHECHRYGDILQDAAEQYQILASGGIFPVSYYVEYGVSSYVTTVEDVIYVYRGDGSLVVVVEFLDFYVGDCVLIRCKNNRWVFVGYNVYYFMLLPDDVFLTYSFVLTENGHRYYYIKGKNFTYLLNDRYCAIHNLYVEGRTDPYEDTGYVSKKGIPIVKGVFDGILFMDNPQEESDEESDDDVVFEMKEADSDDDVVYEMKEEKGN